MDELEPMLSLMGPTLYGGALAFLRVFTCLSMLPQLERGYVPMRARLLLALLLTLTIQLGLQLPAVPVPEFYPHILVHVAREVVFGAALGLAVRTLTAACQMAGDLVGLNMGLSLSTFFDQTSGEAPLSMGRLFGLIALMLFIALDGHTAVALTLSAHFKVHPSGLLLIEPPSLTAIATLGVDMFRTAVLLAAPVIVVTLLLNVAMGFVMKVVPSLNIFNIGIGILLIGGFIALSYGGEAMRILLGHEIENLPERMRAFAGGP